MLESNRFTHSKREEIVDKVISGLKLKQIADEMNMKPQAIYAASRSYWFNQLLAEKREILQNSDDDK